MIHTVHEIECDNCKRGIGIRATRGEPTVSRREAVARARALGWSIGRRRHLCERCHPQGELGGDE